MPNINTFQEKLNQLAKKQAECIARYNANNADLEAVAQYNQIRFALHKTYNVLKEIDIEEGESL